MIELRNISKKFGEKTVLQNITTSFHKGELTFISGTSGAGKSTLLNIIGGLDSPSEGTVSCDGMDIAGDLFHFRAEKVGFVFQESNLISGMSVTQNIVIATELSGMEIDETEIFEGIAELGIKEPTQKVETLSGGEKQRVAMLRSLYKKADLILADEPTGSLDSENAKIVFETLRKLAEEKCVIVVSHDVDLAKKYADRMITIHDGQIIEDTVIRERSVTLTTSVKKDKKKEILRRVIIPLGRNSVRLRKKKLFSIVATITMAITAIALVICIAGIGNKIAGAVNVNYLESDLIHIFYGFTPNAEYASFPFTESDKNYIESDSSIREVVWQYYQMGEGWFFRNNERETDASIKQINLDEFFRERISTNDITGEFPQKTDEIILAYDVAEKLFGNESAVGKQVDLFGPSGQKIVCSVVGINHTRDPYDKVLTYVSAELMKSALCEELSNEVFARQVINPFYEEFSMGFRTGGFYGAMQCVDGKEKLLYGNTPTSENEVLLSSTVLSYCIDFFNLEHVYSSEDILNGNITREDFEKITSVRLAIDFNGVFEVKISGVYVSDDVELRYTNDLILKLQKPDPIMADIYVEDASNVFAVRDQISKNRGFEAETNQDTLKRSIMSQSVFFEMALIVLGFILALVSVFLLNSYSKIAVLERRKEIAILKSLGAEDRTILGVLLYDSCISIGLSVLCTFVMLILSRILISRFIPQITLIGVFSLLSVGLITGLIFALLLLLLTVIEMKGFVRKMPAELLRE